MIDGKLIIDLNCCLKIIVFDREEIMNKLYLIQKLNGRKKQLIQLSVDIFVYLVVVLSMLIIRPSFDNALTARTVILQAVIGLFVLFLVRLSCGIYRRTNKGIGAKLYFDYFCSDVISMLLVIIAQRILFYTDRIEVLTIATISLLSLALTLLFRYMNYLKMMNSIDLTELIPFSPPDISELEIKEVEDTLRSGWITTGPKTKKLNRD